jgi:hypothetical protein
VLDTGPVFISRWSASWRERVAILLTGKLWLSVHSYAHPPVSIYTAHPWVKAWWTRWPWLARRIAAYQAGREIRRGVREAVRAEEMWNPEWPRR